MKLSKHCIYFILIFLCSSCVRDDHFSICFTGDLMLDRNVKYKINTDGNQYFSSSLNKILKGYQFRVINLECPMTHIHNPIEKQYNFKADLESIELLKASFITHAGIANNHINDQNSAGARETFNLLLTSNIIPFGYNSESASICKPVEIFKNGLKIAVFAFMHLAVPPEVSSNICICKENLFQQIKLYKIANPHALITSYIHWGIEYHRTPSKEQQLLAKILIDSGVDVIIGHHPHVVQSIEFYKSKPIFYSLGNFIFDQHQPNSKQGIVVGLSANGSALKYTIIPYKIEGNRPVPVTNTEKEMMRFSLIEISGNIILTNYETGWLLNEKSDNIYSNLNHEIKDSPQTNKFEDIPLNYKTNNNLTFDSHEICDKNFCGIVSLEKLTNLPGYRLRIKNKQNGQMDDLHIKFPVYRFDISDINNDGKTEILLGVIKTTHFEPVLDKRLYIFRIDSFQIRPLWLGSRVCMDLVDFKSISFHKKNRIITLEKSKNNLYCIGFYEWQNFGLRHITYKYENSDYKTALKHFNYEDK